MLAVGLSLLITMVRINTILMLATMPSSVATVTWLLQLIWLPMHLLQRAPQLRTMLKNMIWQLPGHVRLTRKITLRNCLGKFSTLAFCVANLYH